MKVPPPTSASMQKGRQIGGNKPCGRAWTVRAQGGWAVHQVTAPPPWQPCAPHTLLNGGACTRLSCKDPEKQKCPPTIQQHASPTFLLQLGNRVSSKGS